MDTSALQQLFFKVRSNKAFELFVIIVIILSALAIGVKTYDIPPSLRRLLNWSDTAITVIFLMEIVVRFLGEKNKRRFFHNGWNVFDTLIVVISLIPIEDSEMAFVGRLVRIFRVLRMVSIIPELRILMNSLIKALPQLGYIVLLMFIIFYIYGSFGTLLFEKINPVLWGDVGIAMLTLFRVMTFEDWTDVMYETQEVYGYSWVFYLSFIFFTAFAFLNMVIGVVVGVMEEEHAKARTEDPNIMSEDNKLDQINLKIEKLQETINRLENTLSKN